MAGCERILVVEDDPDLLDLVGQAIEETGLAAICCGSAAEALSRLADGPLPDLILLDLAMPHVSGVELVGKIRAEPAWRTLPVVAFSGYPEARFPGLPVDAFMNKPFDLAQLGDVIQRLCGTSSEATGT